jgi:ISXO2-like transposase domain
LLSSQFARSGRLVGNEEVSSLGGPVRVVPILEANIAREARIMTDELALYRGVGWNYADHGIVTHSRGEYVSTQDPTVHTNTIEGFFSIFKRGMRGVYQHASKKHLHRYMAEFDFRYSNRAALGVDDTTRAARALKGIVGKRLTYRTTRSWGPAFEWRGAAV